MRDRFETSLREVQVRTSVRLEKCYLKHGTSIAVRLYVIDKVPGGAIAATIQRSSIRELIGALAIPARTALVMAPAAPLRRSANPSLFRAMKSRPPRPRPFHAPIRNNVLPVAYSALATPAPLREPVGVVPPYRPDRKARVEGKSVSVR